MILLWQEKKSVPLQARTICRMWDDCGVMATNLSCYGSVLLEEEKKWLTSLDKKIAEPPKTAGDAEEVSEDLDVSYCYYFTAIVELHSMSCASCCLCLLPFLPECHALYIASSPALG